MSRRKKQEKILYVAVPPGGFLARNIRETDPEEWALAESFFGDQVWKTLKKLVVASPAALRGEIILVQKEDVTELCVGGNLLFAGRAVDIKAVVGNNANIGHADWPTLSVKSTS